MVEESLKYRCFFYIQYTKPAHDGDACTWQQHRVITILWKRAKVFKKAKLYICCWETRMKI